MKTEHAADKAVHLLEVQMVRWRFDSKRKRDGECWIIQQLRKQLTAEREGWGKQFTATMTVLGETQKRLAADREIHEAAVRASKHAINELHKQLAAEREAYALALQMKNIETTRANEAEQLLADERKERERAGKAANEYYAEICKLRDQLVHANDMWDRASRQADTLAEYLVDAKAELRVTQNKLAAAQAAYPLPDGRTK